MLPAGLEHDVAKFRSKLTPDAQRELDLLLERAVQEGQLLELKARLAFLKSKLGGGQGG